MLKLTIDNNVIAINEDSEVVLNFNNPNLQDSKNDNTYPFTIPLEANRNSIGYPERLSSNDFNKNLKATLSFCGINILSGNINISNINNTEAEIFISTDKTNFWTKYKDVKINDLDLGKEENINILNSINSATKLDNKPYCAVTLQKCKDGKAIAYANSWDSSIHKFDFHNFIPFFKVKSILELLFNLDGYSIVNNSRTFSKLSDILIFNKTEIIEIYNQNLNNLIYKDHLPNIKVYDFLEEISKKFSIVFLINDFTKTVTISNIRQDNETENIINISDRIMKEISQDKEQLSINVIYKDADLYQGLPTSITQKILGDSTAEDVQTINHISSTLNTVTVVLPGYKFPISTLSVDMDTIQDDYLLFFRKGILNTYDSFDPKAITLDWEYIYNTYHNYKQLTYDKNIECELELISKLTDLSQLMNLFSGVVIARNQKFIIISQEIVFKNNKIESHTIIANPII